MKSRSKFSIYSVGVVAADKDTGTWDIEVIPSEIIVSANGEIDVTPEKKTSNVVTLSGDNSSVETEESFSLTATWLQLGSTRSSPPDVCKGETVLLFHYEGVDKYYWVPLFFEPDLRKQETAVFYYSNTPDIDDKENLLEKGYWFKIDTAGKEIQMHTSDNDEEKTTYDFNINTKDGLITLEDGKENKIELNSEEDNLTYDIKNDIVVVTGNDYKATVNNNVEIEFKKISLSNGSDELISVLLELLDAMIAEKHIGNMGAPTTLDPGSIAKYNQIKAKIQGFKK